MLYEPTNSDNEEKEIYNLISNCLINLKILTTNIEKSLVCQKCAHEKAVQTKLEK